MSRITLSDRVAIEAGLYAKLSLKKIAEKIHKSPRYVSEELKRNSTKIKGIAPTEKIAGTPRSARGQSCAATLSVRRNVSAARAWIARPSAGHITIRPAFSCSGRPMSAIHAASGGNASWIAHTTSPSRPMPWPGGATRTLGAIRIYEEKNLRLWTNWSLR